jgi:hypothetical protein
MGIMGQRKAALKGFFIYDLRSTMDDVGIADWRLAIADLGGSLYGVFF